MREIKFRAYIKSRKEMLNLVGFVNNDDITIILHYIKLDTIYSEVFLQSEVELMQFINYQDKNGKEIFKGDIVKYVCHFEVKFGDFAIKGFAQNGWYLQSEDGITCLNGISRYEVIGNIYENPELVGEVVNELQ